jgi:hypothetical protein
MYFGRRSKHIVGVITKAHPSIRSVQCYSFQDVLAQITYTGGDPYKVGLVPVLQDVDHDIHTLTTFGGFRLVSTAEIPFLTSFLDQKRSEEILATAPAQPPSLYGWRWS